METTQKLLVVGGIAARRSPLARSPLAARREARTGAFS
jgi:hypothetical protein